MIEPRRSLGRQLGVALLLAAVYQLFALFVAWLVMPHVHLHTDGFVNGAAAVAVVGLLFPGVFLVSSVPDFWGGYGALCVACAINLFVFTAIAFVWLHWHPRARASTTAGPKSLAA